MIGPNVQRQYNKGTYTAIFQCCGVLVGLLQAMVQARIHKGLFVGSREAALEKGRGRIISIQNGGETKERYV